MKKLIAIMLSVMLMISACAFAEGIGLTMNNIQLDLGDGNVLDLSGIDLIAGVAEDETRSGGYIGLAANGSDIIRAGITATQDQIRLSLTGLSDTYVITMEEIMALAETSGVSVNSVLQGDVSSLLSEQDMMSLMAIAMQAMGSVNITDAGTTDIDGVTYAAQNIAIPEENATALINSVAVFLDSKPELLAAMGISSLTELIASSGLKASVEGQLLAAEGATIADIYLTVADNSDPEGSTVEFYFEGKQDNSLAIAEGLNAKDYTFTIAAEANGGYAEVLTLGATINTVAETGEPAALLCGAYVPVGVDEAGEPIYDGGFLNVYAPVAQGAGMWQLSVFNMDQSAMADFMYGTDAEGMKNVYAYVLAGTDAVEISLVGKEADADLAVNASVQGINCGLTADVSKYGINTDWMPGEGASTVSIMEMVMASAMGQESAQMQKLTAEAQAVLVNVIYGLAAANPTLATLISGAMMG